jgi:hypothetical protein
LKSGWAGRLGVVTALAALCLLCVASGSLSSAKADPVESGKLRLTLDRDLYRSFGGAGVRITGRGGAAVDRRVIEMPLEEGILGPHDGSGYVFAGGRLRLRAGNRSVLLKAVLLNTTKAKLSARIAGKTVVVAGADGISGRRSDFGIDVRVRSLALTAKGARALGSGLGLRGVFVAGRPLGAGAIEAETSTVPLHGGTLALSFDEGFREKLAAAGILVTPEDAAVAVGAIPLAFSFPDLTGDLNRTLTHGGARSRSGIRLTQGVWTPPTETSFDLTNPPSVFIDEIGVNFESDFAAAIWRFPAGNASEARLGQIDFGSGTGFDPASGAIAGGPVSIALSPDAAGLLNQAFPGSAQKFSAGEPLGSLAFSASIK